MMEELSASADTPDDLRRFLERIFQEDQADGHRHADRCLQELEAHEDAFAAFAGTDLADAYWDAVSREALHLAQAAGMRNESGTAIRMLDKALVAAKKSQPDFYPDGAGWVPYLEATKAYFASGKAAMKELVSECGWNRGVVERLIRGLEENPEPDYRRDY